MGVAIVLALLLPIEIQRKWSESDGGSGLRGKAISWEGRGIANILEKWDKKAKSASHEIFEITRDLERASALGELDSSSARAEISRA